MQDASSSGRRKFLQTISGTGAAMLTAGMINPVQANLLRPSDPSKGHVLLAKPYLQDPTPESMVVMWISNLPSYSWVEFGETEALGRKAHSITNGLVDAYNRINRIALRGLKPGTKYFYRVCSKEIRGFEPYNLTYGQTITSEAYSFTTMQQDPDNISWLVMNDIHDRPASISHLAAMNQGTPFDFMFFNGDLFDFQTDEQQIIDHMLQPCSESFATNIPFLFVRGNHETRGKYRQELHHYFCNPQGQQYFSFTHGPVHFIVLDTGEDKPDDAPVYAGIVDFDSYREEQAQWLLTVMQSRAYKKAAYRVVMMHIPPFHSGDWHGTLHCRGQFNPLFNKYRIDLCICGHTHRYGIHPPEPGQHHYPIIIGGGPKAGERTLIRVQADRKQLLLTMLDDQQKEVGRYAVNAR